MILCGRWSTFEDFVFLVVTCLEVKDVVVQFLCDELVFLETFVCDVEDWVFVGGLVVHVEDNVGFWDGDYSWDISCFWFYSVFADRDMHIGGISFKKLYGSQWSQIAYWFWFQSITIIPFKVSAHDSILKWASVILFRFDNLTRHFDAFKAFSWEGIDINRAWMYKNADCITIRRIWISPIYISFE